MTDKKELIKNIYLYSATFIGLILIIIASIQLIDLGLKTFIFKKADEVIVYPVYQKLFDPEGKELTEEEIKKQQEEQRQFEIKQREIEKQRKAANSLAMLIVGIPIFIYHLKLTKRNDETKN
ncbi:MAG: hypothetical protein KatS3mg095_0479 [Candidatus Parcubacteria bacterium]|nr:MAG: hypothetical protein KatS3mg095_0479 [Candidatus Parcubacteria bacterium]